MAAVLGLNCHIFRNTGTYGSPVWVAYDNVEDSKLAINADEADATTRANGGWGASEPAILRAGVEFSSVWDHADVGQQIFVTAFTGRTSLDLAVIDGASSGGGSQGLRALYKVFKMERGEPIAGLAAVDFGVKPCYNVANNPTWATFT